LNYKFVQKPAPGNALGLIRFTLTNPYGIYVHDTPYKSLFVKSGRTFSSGCIRAADVQTLANFLLGPCPNGRRKPMRPFAKPATAWQKKLPYEGNGGRPSHRRHRS
ncbi:MAG: L,D-transpeptidase family protein, partial [Sneathiella sp.]|nr:L,D-transpeptidase family protein [Sneathiella sp.]